ncbi:MAG: hypothetical protein GVY21_08925 [Gammaproteobacteria bacterium]|jgi:hypothetical protein|nr:hypothetical protein [Gammaproteobacteria bacterium]
MRKTYLTCCAGLLLATLASAATADWERASDLLGRSVETRDGEPLGRVHDFALDVDGGRIHFVVISVGSFLIEDSFIAVDPAALRDSADPDRMLVLERNADELRSVPRFADTDWPDSADVVAATEAPADAEDPAAEAAGGRGTATISSERKRATLAGGERRIEVTEPEPAPPAPDAAATASASGAQADTAPGVPDGPFARLDANGDGVLDRSEIAHEMRRGDRYAEIDTDADGTIDPEEFAALLARRESDE